MTTEVEFAVQMNGTSESGSGSGSEPEKIKIALSNTAGVHKVYVRPDSSSIIIKSSLPVSLLQEKVESLVQKAVIKGYGGIEKDGVQAAVAIVGGECGFGLGKIEGVVRFIQTNENECVIDGTIDGLSPGLHGLHVHELGDISDGCNRVGEHFSLNNSSKHGSPENDEKRRHTGDLGNIAVTEEGRAQFRIVDRVLKVWDVIGRTIVVTEDRDDLGKGQNARSLIDGNSGRRLACGIIARSAGLFENAKKICACDGVSIWEEKGRPLAGPGRRANL